MCKLARSYEENLLISKVRKKKNQFFATYLYAIYAIKK